MMLPALRSWVAAWTRSLQLGDGSLSNSTLESENTQDAAKSEDLVLGVYTVLAGSRHVSTGWQINYKKRKSVSCYVPTREAGGLGLFPESWCLWGVWPCLSHWTSVNVTCNTEMVPTPPRRADADACNDACGVHPVKSRSCLSFYWCRSRATCQKGALWNQPVPLGNSEFSSFFLSQVFPTLDLLYFLLSLLLLLLWDMMEKAFCTNLGAKSKTASPWQSGSTDSGRGGWKPRSLPGERCLKFCL